MTHMIRGIYKQTVTATTLAALITGAAWADADDAARDEQTVARVAMADEAEGAADADRDRAGEARADAERSRPRWRERPGGDGPRPAFADRKPPRPLTAEQRDELLAVLDRINPQMKDRLERAVKDNPQRAGRVMAHLYHSRRIQELLETRRDDPRRFATMASESRHRVAAAQLARQIRKARQAGDTQRVNELSTRLREQLEGMFEARQALRERELAELERRIDRLRDELKDHRQRKAELIDQALGRIVRGEGRPEADPLDEPADAQADE